MLMICPITITFKCTNEECVACGETWEARAYYELGAVWLRNDDDAVCDECGEEGEQTY